MANNRSGMIRLSSQLVLLLHADGYKDWELHLQGAACAAVTPFQHPALCSLDAHPQGLALAAGLKHTHPILMLAQDPFQTPCTHTCTCAHTLSFRHTRLVTPRSPALILSLRPYSWTARSKAVKWMSGCTTSCWCTPPCSCIRTPRRSSSAAVRNQQENASGAAVQLGGGAPALQSGAKVVQQCI